MGLKLIGEVALDGSGFERGLNAMAGSVKGFIAGAFGLYGIEAMIHKTVDTAKELVTESKRLGVGVEQLQVLKQAAKENSTELDVLAKAFEKLDVAREKALSGSKEGMKLLGRFGQLGISKEDLQSKTAADLFMGPIRGKANAMSPEDLGPILKDVLGKGFGQVIPVLKTDFESLEKKMRTLGTLVSTETAVALHNLENELSLLAQIVAAQLGPALVSLAEIIYKAIAGIAATWAYVKTFLGKWFSDDRSKAMQTTMAATPGYGGWAPGQKEEWDKAQRDQAVKDASERKKAEAVGMTLDEFRQHQKEADIAAAKQAAEKAAQDTFKSWNDPLQEMKKKLAEEAENLKHPKAPKFDVSAADEKEKKAKTFHEKGDSLLRVGNFLGSSKSVLEDIAQRQLTLLQKIEANTRPQSSGSGGMSDDDFPTA